MMTMSFDTYKCKVMDGVKTRLQERNIDAEVKMMDVEKNNGVMLSGICIRMPEQIVAPTVYINNFYENELMVSTAINRVIELGVDDNLPKIDIDIDMFNKYELVKDKIIPRLVNYEANKDMLQSSPHIVIADLAVYFVIDLTIDGRRGSITIGNQLANLWGVDAEQLYDLAIKNMESREMCKYMKMHNVLEQLDDTITDMFDKLCGMYVITTDIFTYGAIAILSKKFMSEMIDIIGSDFYLIPSSVHEWIMVAGKYTDIDSKNEMVREVNANEVGKSEILSDHIYGYSLEDGLHCI